ncbi:MAG: type IV secretory system conjugative DNA transfer family protein, partial [Myxococcota bacterium]
MIGLSGHTVAVVLLPVTALVIPYLGWAMLRRALYDRRGQLFVGACVLSAATLVVLLAFGAELERATSFLDETVRTFWGALAVFSATPAMASLLVLGPAHLAVAAWFYRRDSRTSHGSARWAAFADTAEGHFAKRGDAGGLMLGRWRSKVPGRLDPRFRVTERHVLTAAPTGAGKGVGCVIPNLLEYPGSVIVLDVKAENWHTTHRAREQLGPVHVLDPFGVTGAKCTTIDWLGAIDTTDPECVTTAQLLVDTLVVKTHGTDSHWDDAAAALLQGLLLYIAGYPQADRHVGKLRHSLMLPPVELAELLEEMSADDTGAFGLPARAANALLGKADRERSGVLSTAQRHTQFLDDPRLVESLRPDDSAGGVDWATLKDEVQTVYVVLPPDKLRAYHRYARAVLGLALKELTQTGPGRVPTLVLFDELAQLGHFAAVEDGVSILRGYGVQLWLLVQDFAQLKGTYPSW